jgi:hypothetical protein
MRHSRAIGYDKGRTSKALKQGSLEDIQINSVHCINCEEGKSNFQRYGKAKGRNKRILTAVAHSKIYRTVKHGAKSGRKVWSGFGFTTRELIKHIENQLKPGMTWDNYGEWHIDHVLPISAFHYESTTDPGFRQCWSLANLQPLWRDANFKKGRKIQSPL